MTDRHDKSMTLSGDLKYPDTGITLLLCKRVSLSRRSGHIHVDMPSEQSVDLLLTGSLTGLGC